MQYNCNITCKTKSQSELESNSRNWNTTLSGLELPNSSWPSRLLVYDKPCEFPFLIGEQEYYGCVWTSDKVDSRCYTKSQNLVSDGPVSHTNRPWGYCSEYCPIEKRCNIFVKEKDKFESVLCNNTKGIVNSECNFSDEHSKCIKRNGSENDRICPITKGKDEKWAICKECPKADTTNFLYLSIFLPIIFAIVIVFCFILWWKKYKKMSNGNFKFIQEKNSEKSTEEHKSRKQTKNELGISHVSTDILYYSDEHRSQRKNFLTTSDGDTSKINPNKTLNEQIHVLPYHSRYEIDFESFTTKHVIGNGNFGTVYEGELKIHRLSIQTLKIAIKTVTEHSNKDHITALISEIKILSNLENNLNLVNMLGCCTSKLAADGRLWLVLEFCNKGDIKTYLIEQSNNFISGIYKTNFILQFLL